MRSGDTPVPIPNTMVKTWAADDTALETVWESRWLPDLIKKNWFYQWLEIKKDFWFLMTDKTVKEYIENCIQEIYDKKNIKTSEVIVITIG